MFFEFCKCKKCKGKLTPEISETIQEYTKIYEDRKIIYYSETPFNKDKDLDEFNFFIMKCDNLKCSNRERWSFKDILNTVKLEWSNLAWTAYLRDSSQKLNFREHFTKYIMLKGLNKIVEQRDLETNPLLRDYMRYVEEQSINESED